MRSMSRRTVLRSFTAVAFVAAYGPMAAASVRAPDVFGPVSELEAALLAIMQAGRATPFTQRCAMLRPVLQRTFDLDSVLKRVIGPRWGSLGAAQQAQLQAAFVNYSVASWVANFDSYAGQTFRLLPGSRPVGEDGWIVGTELVPVSGAPHRLDFVMRRTDSGWRAVDVLAEGSISRVAVLRSDFRALLADGTGAALSASLERKATSLSLG